MIIGLISFLFYYLVIKHQIFRPIVVEKISLKKSILIYTTYQGNYRNLMPTINAVKKDFEEFLASKVLTVEFKKLKFFGIYYDNPKNLVDVNKGRAIIGVILDGKAPELDSQEFLDFDGKKRDYSVLNQAKTNSFGAVFPLLGMPSMFAAIMRGYPAIMRWGSSHGLMEKTKCSLEIYDWFGKSLTICFPYGKAAESLLYLSGYEIPEYKQ